MGLHILLNSRNVYFPTIETRAQRHAQMNDPNQGGPQAQAQPAQPQAHPVPPP